MTDQLTTIKERIRAVWGSEKDSYIACMAIVQFLETHTSDAAHLSYAFLIDIAKSADVVDRKKIIQAAEYLAGADIHLLDMKFEFIDDDDSVWPIPYEISEVNKFLQNEEFIHPITGLIDPEFKRKLFVFFAASRDAKLLFGASQKIDK